MVCGPKPVSQGIVINFTARTVEGFGFQAEITAVDQAHVSFNSHPIVRGNHSMLLLGKLDRMTGDLEAILLRTA